MKTTTKIALAAATAALIASSPYAAPASDNWDNNCASCHGSDGKAQTKTGKKLKIKDYSDAAVQAGLKDDDMVKAITDGIKGDNGKEKMKSFKDDLSGDEIKDLVGYIRKFKA
jgi:mono/diheme cytochrome c family protein